MDAITAPPTPHPPTTSIRRRTTGASRCPTSPGSPTLSPASTRSATRPPGSGSGSTSTTSAPTSPTTPGHGHPAASLAPRRFRGRIVLASSMVVYGEGAYPCSAHGRVAAGPRRTRTSPPAGSSHPARGAMPPCNPRCRRGRAARPAQRLRRDQGPPGAPRPGLRDRHRSRRRGLRYHNVYGPRMPRDTPYAGVASIVRSACEADGSAGLRGRPAATRLRPRRRRRPGQRARPSRTHADRWRLQRLLGQVRTIAEMAVAVASHSTASFLAPVVTGEYRLGDVRHVTASPQLAAHRFGFRAQVPYRVGLREFATAPMRSSSPPVAV